MRLHSMDYMFASWHKPGKAWLISGTQACVIQALACDTAQNVIWLISFLFFLKADALNVYINVNVN